MLPFSCLIRQQWPWPRGRPIPVNRYALVQVAIDFTRRKWYQKLRRHEAVMAGAVGADAVGARKSLVVLRFNISGYYERGSPVFMPAASIIQEGFVFTRISDRHTPACLQWTHMSGHHWHRAPQPNRTTTINMCRSLSVRSARFRQKLRGSSAPTTSSSVKGARAAGKSSSISRILSSPTFSTLHRSAYLILR